MRSVQGHDPRVSAEVTGAASPAAGPVVTVRYPASALTSLGAMAYDGETVERVRQVLAGRAGIDEKRMVGGLSFTAGGSMCCGVTGAALMVRVGKDGMQEALAQPHVRPMMLGGRTLSGFICVDPASALTDAELAAWVQRGLHVAAQQPGRRGGRGRPGQPGRPGRS